MALGEKIPENKYLLPALLLGFIAYGLSIFTYIRAQKTLGAAKTSAYYAVAPFIGALLSLVLLGEPLSASYAAAFLIMLTGASLAVYDTLLHVHSHNHTHTFAHAHGGAVHHHTITHTHKHNHYINDDNHKHKHDWGKISCTQ